MKNWCHCEERFLRRSNLFNTEKIASSRLKNVGTRNDTPPKKRQSLSQLSLIIILLTLKNVQTEFIVWTIFNFDIAAHTDQLLTLFHESSFDFWYAKILLAKKDQ